MAKIREGHEIFTSSDLATITKNTNNNNHLENYLLIAQKTGFPTNTIRFLIEKRDRQGYLSTDESYPVYSHLMSYLHTRINQEEYLAIYERL